MIKIEVLRQLLNVDESEFKNLKTDQLRVMLGTFRFFIRALEREINRRTAQLEEKNF